MIGCFGSVTFETNDRRICTFNSLKQSASAGYSEHKRYTKKSQREFEGPQNQSVTFEMKCVGGHGVSTRAMMNKMISICESGTVCTFVIGGCRVGGGKWTVDSVDADYREVWNHGELISVAVNVTATEYN